MAYTTSPISFNVNQLKNTCASCNLHTLCLPMGLSTEDLDQLDELIQTKRRLRVGESLYRAGDDFHAIYAVRSGFFKSTLSNQDGREQVTGFHMSGEIMGMDGIASDVYICDAVALEDSEICLIQYHHLESVLQSCNSLQHHFHKLMSREIMRDQNVMMLLGSMRADERLAAFLLNLSQRYAARGFSRHEFYLRMSRSEIASYLGLKIETISRIFSSFQFDGYIEVHQKHIIIKDMGKLEALISQD
ncbi:MAG TPA: fumarate/nitrate reduction transcriptional regulator Fnr [Burkholderiales bacterium]|nr:fumarate/nitrate reduction transcriptional regulator Fnr [Burkholderiales bacterium]